jgi:hypothetical protein
MGFAAIFGFIIGLILIAVFVAGFDSTVLAADYCPSLAFFSAAS